MTMNSDDPSLFNTSLSEDYATLVEPFGLSVEQIDEIVLNGFRSSFLPGRPQAGAGLGGRSSGWPPEAAAPRPA